MDNKVFILLILLALYFLFYKKEGFDYRRYAALPGSNNMVLTDGNGNLSSIQFPKGMIVIWNGLSTNVPEGWVLCNGENGTPDLRGKFVLGVNPNSDNTTYRTIGGGGGTETNTITIAQMPPHNHDIVGKGDDSGYCATGQCTFYSTDRWSNDKEVRASTSGGKLVVDNTGGGQPINNMPPYMVLAYIMKL